MAGVGMTAEGSLQLQGFECFLERIEFLLLGAEVELQALVSGMQVLVFGKNRSDAVLRKIRLPKQAVHFVQ